MTQSITHLCKTAISFSRLLSFPSNTFFAMHLTATSFWVDFSSANTTSEKAPLGTDRDEQKHNVRQYGLPQPADRHICVQGCGSHAGEGTRPQTAWRPIRLGYGMKPDWHFGVQTSPHHSVLPSCQHQPPPPPHYTQLDLSPSHRHHSNLQNLSYL